ncbi:MAG: hypothetical protein ACLU6Y_15940 [Ruminococcus sp.]
MLLRRLLLARFTSRMQRGNQTECKTLADAILMAPANADKNAAPSQILVTGTIEISDTIVISDKPELCPSQQQRTVL